MAELGLSASFLIGHVYCWGQAFIDDVFFLEKASKLDRTASCKRKCIRWTIHCDDSVTEMNPLRDIEYADFIVLGADPREIEATDLG